MSGLSLTARQLPLLCLVTDPRAWGPAGDQRGNQARITALVRAAVMAGIDIVQIREPGWTGRDLLSLVADCVEIARGTDTMIVVNERADVALAAGADGVHLRSSSYCASILRRVVPEGFVIGRSVHGTHDLGAGEAEGTDYVVAGTVFPSRSKGPDAPILGAGGLSTLVAVSPVPVLAIGGVTTRNSGIVAASGAAGIAAIDLFGDAWRKDGSLVPITQRLRAGFTTHDDQAAAAPPVDETTWQRRS